MQNQYRSHSNQSHYHQTANQQTLGQSLQKLCKAALNFMVLRPQASSQLPTIPPEQRYSAKASLYPYLPTGEEERDWLDRIY